MDLELYLERSLAFTAGRGPSRVGALVTAARIGQMGRLLGESRKYRWDFGILYEVARVAMELESRVLPECNPGDLQYMLAASSGVIR